MAWWVWTLSVAFVVLLFSFQTGYSIVNPNVQKDVGLSVAQVGTIAAVYTWAFAICQFFGGALLDRLGARKVLPISIALVTLGIFIFANASSFEMLLLSQVIVAIGSCTGFVGAGYVGGQWFGMAKFSFMFGLVQVVAALTSAFSQNLIGVALGTMSWRALFNLTAGIRHRCCWFSARSTSGIRLPWSATTRPELASSSARSCAAWAKSPRSGMSGLRRLSAP